MSSVQLLLDYKANIHAKDISDLTALHIAANAQIAHLLVKAGADTNTTSRFLLETPLHKACARGDSVLACQLLCASGCDIHAQMDNGFTPLHLPCLSIRKCRPR